MGLIEAVIKPFKLDDLKEGASRTRRRWNDCYWGPAIWGSHAQGVFLRVERNCQKNSVCQFGDFRLCKVVICGAMMEWSAWLCAWF